MSADEATIVGSLDDMERETLAVLKARRDEIHEGRLEGKHWFLALIEQADAILRRCRAADSRTNARRVA